MPSKDRSSCMKAAFVLSLILTLITVTLICTDVFGLLRSVNITGHFKRFLNLDTTSSRAFSNCTLGNSAECGERFPAQLVSLPGSQEVRTAVSEGSTTTPLIKTALPLSSLLPNTSLVDMRSGEKGLTSTAAPIIRICPDKPSGLVGPVRLFREKIKTKKMLAKYSYVRPGGRLRPANCVAGQRLAIIIPYRNRQDHLHILLNNLIPVLHKQRADANIFVIEQSAGSTFNRGALFNIGYLEAQKIDTFNCFIFHDVDMVPLDDRLLYRCGDDPVHLVSGIQTLNFRLPYNSYFGGVVAMSSDQYMKVNGHSNFYTGWGGEDDDLLIRCREKGYNFTRYPAVIGRYYTHQHNRDKGNEANPDRFSLLKIARQRQNEEGLNSLRYKVNKLEFRPLYIWCHVSIGMKEMIQNTPTYVKYYIKNLLRKTKT